MLVGLRPDCYQARSCGFGRAGHRFARQKTLVAHALKRGAQPRVRTSVALLRHHTNMANRPPRTKLSALVPDEEKQHFQSEFDQSDHTGESAAILLV